jgi:hypothetical protein
LLWFMRPSTIIVLKHHPGSILHINEASKQLQVNW